MNLQEVQYAPALGCACVCGVCKSYASRKRGTLVAAAESVWQIDAPGIPRELLDAFPSFQYPRSAATHRRDRLFRLQTDAPTPPAVAHVDWRTTSAVPLPGFQGSCNTCTSFAVVSAVESLHFLQHHNRIQLAPGFIHTCLLDRACIQGATAEEALDAIAAHGMAYGFPNDYPFPPEQCPTANLYAVQRRLWLAGPNSAMQALASQGPVVGDMWIDPTFLTVGPGEIYDFQPTPDKRLHTVAIIGYDLNERYWIVSNSFGRNWGDGGFGRVAFGSGGLLYQRGGWQILL